MCGIFGFYFKPGAVSEGRRAILAQQLAQLNDERGGHSWGLATVDGGKLDVQRGLGEFKNYGQRLIGSERAIAHTRWATTGATTIENAHPFEVGKIVGAHNGIIYNHGELLKKYNRDFAVDSLHLFAHLDAGLPFDDLEGYGAIEWIERDDLSVIRLCKMMDGELSIVGIGEYGDKGEKMRGVVWSSDEDHLEEALRAAGFKNYFWYTIEVGQVYYVEDGVLYVSERPPLNLAANVGKKKRLKWSDFKDDRKLTAWPDEWDWDDSVGNVKSLYGDDGFAIELSEFEIEDDEGNVVTDMDDRPGLLEDPDWVKYLTPEERKLLEIEKLEQEDLQLFMRGR